MRPRSYLLIIGLAFALAFYARAQSPPPTPRRAYIPGSRVIPTSPIVGALVSAGTPTATTPGVDGQMMVDQNYLYTFLAGSWSKSARTKL